MTVMDGEPLLHLRGVSVDLAGCAVVADVDLDLSMGDWVCVIGPNGAGKSTLLRAVAGLVPSTGVMTVAGRDLRRMDARARACWIGYVAQEPVMPAGLRVLDYVLLGRTAHLRLLGTETQADVDFARGVLADLDLTTFEDRDVATLSGGERQRVALARALAQASPIVLLDEPTTALDMGYQQEVLELIDRLRGQRRIAVLMTMHDLTVSGLYPNTLVLLDHGSVAARGTATEVLTTERIAATYGASVRVIHDPAGPIVVPVRTPTR